MKIFQNFFITAANELETRGWVITSLTIYFAIVFARGYLINMKKPKIKIFPSYLIYTRLSYDVSRLIFLHYNERISIFEDTFSFFFSFNECTKRMPTVKNVNGHGCIYIYMYIYVILNYFAGSLFLTNGREDEIRRQIFSNYIPVDVKHPRKIWSQLDARLI